MAKSDMFTRKQLHYIEFLANPEERGTKVQFAQDIGVSLRTLFRWQNLAGFNNAVYERAMFYLNARLPKTLIALGKASEKGNVEAMKLILQHCGKLKDKVEQEVKVTISWDEEEEAMASSRAS